MRGTARIGETISPQGSTRIPEFFDRLIELYIATTRPKKLQELGAKYPVPNEV